MTLAAPFSRYRGDGKTPQGAPAVTRGEAGVYLADPVLATAVNTALAVEQPLLVTGEPGTGKTTLAWSVASELGLGDVLEFHTRSDHQARDVLYTFDNLSRFYHAQVKDPRAEKPEHYVRFQALGEAIRSASPRVVLIDEIDKAPRDFPNDLLDELDRMAFVVPEAGASYKAVHRPIVVITSNSERQLPDPFLRRCVFHHIDFPDAPRLRQILDQRLGPLHLPGQLADAAIAQFKKLREVEGFEKKPATGELVAWAKALLLAGVDADRLGQLPLGDLPASGAIVKTRDDLARLKALGR